MDAETRLRMDAPRSGTLERLFGECERLGGSDIHVAVCEPPWVRVRGKLSALPLPPLGREEVEGAAAALCALARPLGGDGGAGAMRGATAVDGACSSASGARYRFCVFRENGACAIALRRLEEGFRSFAELGLPDALARFCECHDGLFIVTGPTGSGKSTTLATLVDIVNRTRHGHVVTIEDPVEYVHRSRSCLVQQRQIGRDATSFNSALVEALRQDPDVILVGEIRDLETIRTAITAAETGHLVFTTLHAGDCAGAVERMVAVFPADEQDGVRHQLSMVLRGIFAQHLLPSADGSRRVAACELLVCTPAAANLVATGRFGQLHSVMETGGAHGMFTLEQSLAGRVGAGELPMDAAIRFSRNPEQLLKRIARSGNGALHGNR